MTLHLEGEIFGYLTVIGRAGRKYSGGTYRSLWLCKCICGKEVTKATGTLRAGTSKTCGCCEWHIHHRAAYTSWCSMKQRCDGVNTKDYPRYGGTGITYQESWKTFIPFFIDMGDPPIDNLTGERLSLDRINNNGNYTRENCKWSNRSEQQLNKGKITQSV